MLARARARFSKLTHNIFIPFFWARARAGARAQEAGIMNIHEFQAKQILKKYGIPIPDFFVISTLEELHALLDKHPLNEAVLKVQIHAGGRGKAGGVKLARGRDQIIQSAKELLNKKIVNEQTGPRGLVSHQVLVTPTVKIIHEYYLGIVIDRQLAQKVFIASPSGGMDIEAVAHESPEKVLHLPIPEDGFRSFHFLRLTKFMGWEGDIAQQGKNIISGMIKAFDETDASLLEINPLVLSDEQQLLALDAKLIVDDNGLFRQEKIKHYMDFNQMSPQEAQALKYDLAYVALEGDIGCMVNGAGLAMATMDIIKYCGGSPANFLDVGGGASKEKIAEGFKIILSDPHVKAILINIFGGIMNCETIAEGIIAAVGGSTVPVPLIVRMEGTHVEKGKALLEKSKLKIMIADDLADAAKMAVNAAHKRGVADGYIG